MADIADMSRQVYPSIVGLTPLQVSHSVVGYGIVIVGNALYLGSYFEVDRSIQGIISYLGGS